MCGIVGYAGCEKAGPILFDTLKRLEYRGYDSAGVAIISDGDLLVFKSAGRIADLENSYMKDGAPGSCTGIGHTRWATHGPPTTENAHPHVSGDVAVVHNGIIQNYLELKEELLSRGFVFRSDTDTEVLAHLISSFYRGDLEDAVRSAINQVDGSYAIAALARGMSHLVCARNESPLVIGIGKGANYVASDVSALLPYTRDIVRMNDGEIAVIDEEAVVVKDLGGILIPLELEKVDWDVEAAERAGYPHFMLKEIHEQPRAVQETIASRISEMDGEVRIDIGLTVDEIRALDRVSIVACGTSYHAAVLAKYLYPKAAGLPVDVEMASEFQHQLLRPGTLLLSITQSGETADTLNAMKKASTLVLRGSP